MRVIPRWKRLGIFYPTVVESHESELPTQSYDQISEGVSCKNVKPSEPGQKSHFSKGDSVAHAHGRVQHDHGRVKHAQGVFHTPKGLLSVVNGPGLYKIRFLVAHFIF